MRKLRARMIGFALGVLTFPLILYLYFNAVVCAR